jgi:hypothetical protein
MFRRGLWNCLAIIWVAGTEFIGHNDVAPADAPARASNLKMCVLRESSISFPVGRAFLLAMQ